MRLAVENYTTKYTKRTKHFLGVLGVLGGLKKPCENPSAFCG